MKLIYTLLFLSVSFVSLGQLADTSQVIVTGNCWGGVKKDTTVKKVRYSCGLIKMETPAEPLLVIDGILYKYDSFNLIDPNDIESIDILKDPTAMTAIFSCYSARGVIIITTKSARIRTFTIKDFINGNPVPGASVSFISANKKDTIFYIANESGIVTTSKLIPGAEYSIKASSIGYKTLQQDFVNTANGYPRNILLSREVKACEEVMLSSVVCSRWIRCGGLIRVIRDKYKAAKNMTNTKGLTKIYPNPVSKGAAISCQWKEMEGTVTELRLVSLDGKTLLRQTVTNKGNTGLAQLHADTRWAAGIYFLQIICEKGKVLASEKVILQ